MAVSNAGSASAGSGNAGFDTAAEAEFAGGAGGESAPSIDAAQVEALISALDPEELEQAFSAEVGLGGTAGAAAPEAAPASRSRRRRRA